MIDLINYAVRSRKVDAPTGIVQFTVALCDVNVPREFIGNAKLSRAIDAVAVNSPHLASSSPKTGISRVGSSAFFDANTFSSLLTEDEGGQDTNRAF